MDPSALPVVLVLLAILALSLGTTQVVLPALKARRAGQQIRAQLPAFLRTLSRLTRQGHTPAVALQHASREVPGVLGDELRRICEEQRNGQAFGASLAALCARRPQIPELNLFSQGVLLSAEFGGDPSVLLPRLERTLADRIATQEAIDAESSQLRLNMALLCSVGPVAALGICLVQPDYILSALADPLGKTLFAAAGLWLLLGTGLIASLLRRRL